VKEMMNPIDDKEDILVIFAIIPQTQIEMRVIRGENTRKIPAEVATPFPPLKRSQIGYI
jgi:hypothetical protein